MNFVNSKIVKICISLVSVITLSGFDWSIDWSRRQVDFDKVQNQDRRPTSEINQSPLGFLSEEIVGVVERSTQTYEVADEIVILNTENGFVPAHLKLRKDRQYKISIVNVNAKEKNVSFIMDAFSEMHSTFFGHVRTLTIVPKVDGVFTYQCPELNYEGQITVYSGKGTPPPELRLKSAEVKNLPTKKMKQSGVIPPSQEEELIPTKDRKPASIEDELLKEFIE